MLYTCLNIHSWGENCDIHSELSCSLYILKINCMNYRFEVLDKKN